jgi:hypothetical protein
MAERSSFHRTLLQLRLQEEADCRHELIAAQNELGLVRRKISAFDDAIDRCRRAETGSFADGDDVVGRGCRRESQGLVLLRAREVSNLAAVKACMVRTRQQLAEAVRRRRALGLVDATMEVNFKLGRSRGMSACYVDADIEAKFIAAQPQQMQRA